MVTIPWCAGTLNVKRIVLNSGLDYTPAIQNEADRLNLPVVLDNDQIAPKAGDLWIGLCPQKGWGDLAGECGEARTIEDSIVHARLYDAQAS